jgi:hypothetical protein
MDSASQDSMIREVIMEMVMIIKVEKIVRKLLNKRPVRVVIHSLEVSFEINLMPFFLFPKKIHILTLAYA